MSVVEEDSSPRSCFGWERSQSASTRLKGRSGARPPTPTRVVCAPGMYGLEASSYRSRTGSFPVVMTSDFLEHVEDLTSVMRQCARVLAPGGLFLYDTINRTWLTRIFHIGVLQEWRRLVPEDTHDWRQFIKPRELEATMKNVDIHPVETLGLFPVAPIRFALHLLRHRRGRDTMPAFRIGAWTGGSYVGYGVKEIGDNDSLPAAGGSNV